MREGRKASSSENATKKKNKASANIQIFLSKNKNPNSENPIKKIAPKKKKETRFLFSAMIIKGKLMRNAVHKTGKYKIHCLTPRSACKLKGKLTKFAVKITCKIKILRFKGNNTGSFNNAMNCFVSGSASSCQ